MVLVGFGLADHEAAVHRQAGNLDVEPLAVFVRPGCADLGPVGFLALAFDVVDGVGGLVGSVVIRFFPLVSPATSIEAGLGVQAAALRRSRSAGHTGAQRTERAARLTGKGHDAKPDHTQAEMTSDGTWENQQPGNNLHTPLVRRIENWTMAALGTADGSTLSFAGPPRHACH